jgi:hypothetical protein
VRKSKIIEMAVAAVLLPALMGDACGRGETPAPAPTKDERPGCPDITFRSPEDRCFILQTYVESRLGPYDVYIHISGGIGTYPEHVPVASGGWKHALVYASGKKLNIVLTVEPSARGSRDGYCSITDGSAYARDFVKNSRPDGSGVDLANCTLTTQQ